MIVSHMVSSFYFLKFSLAFFFTVLHISAYSILCLLSPYFTIPRLFDFRARVGDGILDLCGLIIALATVDALCWIMSVMVSLILSISCSSCGDSNRFLNSSWNSILFDPIRVASTLGGLLVNNSFLSTSSSSLVLLITSLWFSQC